MTMQRKSAWPGCSVLFIAFLLAACRLADDVGPVGVLGYNHTDTDVSQFLVNGAAGGGFVEAHHEGGTSCCVSIPKNWRSGLTAEVEWKTDLKSYTRRSVVIPEYEPSDGQMAVHFLRNGDVKIFVTSLFPGHPNYPLKDPESSLTRDGSAIGNEWKGKEEER